MEAFKSKRVLLEIRSAQEYKGSINYTASGIIEPDKVMDFFGLAGKTVNQDEKDGGSAMASVAGTPTANNPSAKKMVLKA